MHSYALDRRPKLICIPTHVYIHFYKLIYIFIYLYAFICIFVFSFKKLRILFHSTRMSYHVPLEAVGINGQQFNLSFIILRASKDKAWTLFFRRTNWTSEVPIPKSFYTLDLGNHGKHIYQPCAPFYLSGDECGSWLEWTEIRPDIEEETIKMLRYTKTLESLLEDPNTKTEISSSIQYAVWADQLSTTPQTLGNHTRMEDLVRRTMSSTTRNVANIVISGLRNDIRNLLHAGSPRRDRSRSPKRQQRAELTSPQNNSTMPQYYIPQQYMIQPTTSGTTQPGSQLPQLQQWNNVVTGQQQPIQLYQPPRTN